MAKPSHSLVATLVLTALMIAGQRRARADISSDVYSDTKKIIEDLLTGEVAQTLVPRLVCRGGRRVAPARAADDSRVWVWTDNDGIKVAYELLALEFYGRSFQRVYSRQFGAVRDSVTAETADLAGYLVLKALESTSPTLDPAALLSRLDTSNDQAQEMSCEKRVRQVLEGGAFSTLGASPLDTACEGARTVSCRLALAVRALLEKRQELAENEVFAGAAEVITDLLRVNVPSADERRMDAAIAAFIGSTLRRELDVEHARQFVIASLTAVTGVPAATVETLWANYTSEITTLLTTFSVARMRDGGIEVAAAAGALFGSGGTIEVICKARPKALGCTSGQELQRVVASPRLKSLVLPLFAAASRGDLREVSNSVVLLLFRQAGDVDCSAQEPDSESNANCDTLLYRRFAESVITYTIDIAEEHAASDAARAAFIAATTDVVRQIGKAGGFARRRWYGFLVPELNLRASWNPAYVNQSTSSLRYVASIDAIKYRAIFAYSPRLYTALHVSLIDPLAPLGELALRKNANTDYSDQEKLAWNFLAPRLEIVLGIPSLSQHLAVGGGVSLRLVVPVLQSSQMGDGQERSAYSYQTLWSDSNGREHWPQFVEFGFFVKYVI